MPFLTKKKFMQIQFYKHRINIYLLNLLYCSNNNPHTAKSPPFQLFIGFIHETCIVDLKYYKIIKILL